MVARSKEQVRKQTPLMHFGPPARCSRAGVTDQTVRELAKRGIAVRAGRGLYPEPSDGALARL